MEGWRAGGKTRLPRPVSPFTRPRGAAAAARSRAVRRAEAADEQQRSGAPGPHPRGCAEPRQRGGWQGAHFHLRRHNGPFGCRGALARTRTVRLAFGACVDTGSFSRWFSLPFGRPLAAAPFSAGSGFPHSVNPAGGPRPAHAAAASAGTAASPRSSHSLPAAELAPLAASRSRNHPVPALRGATGEGAAPPAPQLPPAPASVPPEQLRWRRRWGVGQSSDSAPGPAYCQDSPGAAGRAVSHLLVPDRKT